MSKPDRFERMVEDLEFMGHYGGTDIPVCESVDVVKLLRREHDWMKRMVKAELHAAQQAAIQAKSTPQAFGHRCREAQCRDILGRLTRRRQ